MRLSTTQPCRISQATFMTSQCVSSLSCCHRFSRWLSFFRMVWIDTTHVVSSPFAFFSYSVFKEHRWCFGVSHRVTVNLSFSVVSLPFVRSLCLHCSTLCIHCQEDLFFRFSLSSYQFAVNPLPVAFALCGVLSSSTTLSVHTLQIAFSEIVGGVPCGVPSVSSLTVHIVSWCVSKINPKSALLWEEILFA